MSDQEPTPTTQANVLPNLLDIVEPLEALELDPSPASSDITERIRKSKRIQKAARLTRDRSVLTVNGPPNQEINLYDILRIKVPPTPEEFTFNEDGKLSKSTRPPTHTERNFPLEEQLNGIVPFAPLVDQLFLHAERLLLEHEPLQPNDPWITSVHPFYTSRLLPSRISTEHDTEDWVWSVLVRPAISAIQALGEKTPWQSRQDFPNLRSCGGKEHIADGLVLGKTAEDIKQVAEIKNDTVLQDGLLAFRLMTASWRGMPLGRAIKFHWPTKAKASTFSKETKIIVQLWSQMIAKRVKYAMLSSYSRTFFFARQAHQPGILFMSREYDIEDATPLLANFAFSALALGKISHSLMWLPTANKDWWRTHKDLKDSNGVEIQRDADGNLEFGPDDRTYPSAYINETVIRPDSLAFIDELLK